MCMLSPPATPSLEDTNSSCSVGSLLSMRMHEDHHPQTPTQSSLTVSACSGAPYQFLLH